MVHFICVTCETQFSEALPCWAASRRFAPGAGASVRWVGYMSEPNPIAPPAPAAAQRAQRAAALGGEL